MSASRTEELGQLLILELEDDRWNSALEKRLQSIQPGGILLRQENLRIPETAAEFLGKISRAFDAPLFFALEEVGEAIYPLQNFFPALPAQHVVGTIGEKAARTAGDLSGAAVNLLGFNAHFAPLLDFATDATAVSAQPGSFDRDGELVADLGEALIQGLQRHGVLACPWDFPGFGNARPDSQTGRFISSKPMARMWREDLVPYRRLLPLVQLVLVSHIAYKAYDLNSAIPASLSANVLEGLLRVKLGYGGVAIANFSGHLGKEFVKVESIPKSIAAGCDMVVAGQGGSPIEAVFGSLKSAFDTGTLPAERVDEALKRIARAKKGLRLPTGKFSKKAFDKLCREFEEFGKECKLAEREIV
jgi:beta-N-acetylhexosaminidase